MIRVRVQGGMGNQLFQYAFARELQERTQYNIQLVTSWYTRDKEIGRKFILDHFNCKYNVVPQNDTYRCQYHIKDDFTEIVLSDIKDDTFYDGYWQREAFFHDIGAKLANELLLQHQYIPNKIYALARKMKQENSVSIHVRRTDYLNIAEMATCSEEYYRDSLQFICNRINGIYVYVFSDDQEWVKEHFHFLQKYKIQFVNTGKDYLDWYLMSSCRHNVIANSTYSWWAAYLNSNKDKIVVMPEKWNSAFDMTGLYLREWNVI